jgi:hypothetical protein
MLLCETWSVNTNSSAIKECTPPGFGYIETPRLSRGGGVAIIYNTKVARTQISLPFQPKTFEYCICTFQLSFVKITICNIYRPTNAVSNSSANRTIFLHEISLLFDNMAVIPTHVAIGGDFNIHINDVNDKFGRDFSVILEQSGFLQHINTATHISGNLLDLFITSKGLSPLCTVVPGISDHDIVLAMLPLEAEYNSSRVTISYRNWKSVDMDSLRADIIQRNIADHLANNNYDPVYLTDVFYGLLSDLADKHAPVTTRTISVRPHSPWFDGTCRSAKLNVRRLERIWRKNKAVPGTKRNYYAAKSDFSRICQSTMESYWKRKLLATTSKNKWPIIHAILMDKQHRADPPVGANEFSDYFVRKIDAIRDGIVTSNINNNTTPIDNAPIQHTVAPLTSFSRVSEQLVATMVRAAKNKCCSLDPMPPSIIKQLIEELCPLITGIINASLSSASMPIRERHALVTPVLKRTGLDADDLKNYRPVSNLSFLSKLQERAVSAQLKQHIDGGGLYPKHQSAYRTNFSTETALLKLHNDIVFNKCQGNGTALIMLDLSAAFDTIDTATLLHRLESMFNVVGDCNTWIKNYLSNRTQSVKVGTTSSDRQQLKYGVPQGSVLGPSLFNLYTAPLEDVVGKSDINIMSYADDVMLYTSFNTNNYDKRITNLVNTINNVISSWYDDNQLKLNPDKTELIYFHRGTIPPVNVIIGGNIIKPSVSVTVLGVILDSELSFFPHINHLVKICRWQLREIRRVRPRLDNATAETIIRSFVISRIDYGNSLFSGLPDTTIKPITLVFNMAARIISQTPIMDHITPVLRQLHWLPVRARINYKLCYLTFRCLKGLAPEYLSERLTLAATPRLAAAHYLVGTTERSRQFSSMATAAWNVLPSNVRDPTLSNDGFRRKLKTHLYREVFL